MVAVRILSGAADDAVVTILRRIDMCCSAVMTTATRNTAEGAVVTGAGGAADGSVELRVYNDLRTRMSF